MTDTPEFSGYDGDVLIHVGLHKTGTSWLQKNIFQALDGKSLSYCGDLDIIYRALIWPEEVQFSPPAVVEAFADILGDAKASGRLPVISGEALAGKPFHAKFHRSVVAGRIAQVFPNAHILLTIREQNSVIRSMYGQYVRFGYTSSLAEFLTQPEAASSFSPILDKSFYDYDALIGAYRRHFPAERILVAPFERMVAEPDFILTQMRSKTGIDAPLSAIRQDTGKVVNSAWSDTAYFAVRQMNRLFSQDARWQYKPGRFSPNSVGHWVDVWTPKARRKKTAQRARALIAEHIGDYYRPSNRATSQIIGQDLGELGYAT